MSGKQSHSLIDLRDISVNGIDVRKRVSGLRELLLRGGKAFNENLKIPILKNVTFKAVDGDKVVFLGRNGAGKSSLMKVISGNYPVHSGYVNVVGSVVPLIEMGAGFNSELSGRINIKNTFVYRGKLREYSKELEEKIIEFSELGNKIDLPIKKYSSGMMARLAFSTAIFQSPDILLLDEVFATGDGAFLQKSKLAIMNILEKSNIALFVSHSDDIIELCNRAILIEEGRIIREDSPKDLYNYYKKNILHI